MDGIPMLAGFFAFNATGPVLCVWPTLILIRKRIDSRVRPWNIAMSSVIAVLCAVSVSFLCIPLIPGPRHLDGVMGLVVSLGSMFCVAVVLYAIVFRFLLKLPEGGKLSVKSSGALSLLPLTVVYVALAVFLYREEVKDREKYFARMDTIVSANACACRTWNWGFWSPSEQNFTVLMPSEPTESNQSFETGNPESLDMKFLIAKPSESVEFGVLWTKLSDEVDDADTDTVLDAVIEGLVRDGAELLSTEVVRLDEHYGREWEMLKEEGKSFLVNRTFIVGQTHYQVIYAAPRGEECRRHMRHFLDSFQLTMPAADEAPPDEHLDTNSQKQ